MPVCRFRSQTCTSGFGRRRVLPRWDVGRRPAAVVHVSVLRPDGLHGADPPGACLRWPRGRHHRSGQLPPSLTGSLAHSLTRSLTHSLAHSLAHWLTRSLAPSLSLPLSTLPLPLPLSLPRSLAHSLTRSLAHSLTDSPTDQFVTTVVYVGQLQQPSWVVLICLPVHSQKTNTRDTHRTTRFVYKCKLTMITFPECHTPRMRGGGWKKYETLHVFYNDCKLMRRPLTGDLTGFGSSAGECGWRNALCARYRCVPSVRRCPAVTPTTWPTTSPLISPWSTAPRAISYPLRRPKQHLCACPFVRLSACPFVCLSACPLVRLSVCPFVRDKWKSTRTGWCHTAITPLGILRSMDHWHDM